MGDFVTALLGELEICGLEWDLRPTTLYFGGGTPSLLSHRDLERLLQGFRDRLPLQDLTEWTLEANPKTFDAAKARMMRQLGVTRISLGVQSWTPKHLQTLGRDHSPEEAAGSYAMLTDAGIPVVNIDLMFSLPGQTLDDWRTNLERTISLQPKHVSAYNLTYEEDTAFFDQLGHGRFQDDEKTNADHFYLADDILTNAGYEHYEISNYALPGNLSHHNQAYWTGENYLGLGPSAVSTVGSKRWRNPPDTARYVATKPNNRAKLREHEAPLTNANRHNERVALLLRTTAGLPIRLLDPSVWDRAQDLVQEGLLQQCQNTIRMTRSSRALVDPVAAELMI